MQRRDATKLILTGTLATPALIRPSFATEREAPSTQAEVEKTRQLRLSLTTGTIVPSFFCILFVTAVAALPFIFWVQALRSRMNWEKSNQGDATGIPLVGQFFDEPPDKILARSVPLGLFFFIGNMLILRVLASSPNNAEFEPPEKLSFLNRDDHYFIDFRGRRSDPPSGLESFNFDRAKPVGKGYYDKKTKSMTGVFGPVVGILERKS